MNVCSSSSPTKLSKGPPAKSTPFSCRYKGIGSLASGAWAALSPWNLATLSSPHEPWALNLQHHHSEHGKWFSRLAIELPTSNPFRHTKSGSETRRLCVHWLPLNLLKQNIMKVKLERRRLKDGYEYHQPSGVLQTSLTNEIVVLGGWNFPHQTNYWVSGTTMFPSFGSI